MLAQLHSGSEGSAPGGHQHRPKDRRLPSPHTGRTTPFPLSQKSPEHYEGHLPSWSLSVWTVWYRSINTRTNRLKHSLTLSAAENNNNVQYGIWMGQKVCTSVDCFMQWLCVHAVCAYVCCQCCFMFLSILYGRIEYSNRYSRIFYSSFFFLMQTQWMMHWLESTFNLTMTIKYSIHLPAPLRLSWFVLDKYSPNALAAL